MPLSMRSLLFLLTPFALLKYHTSGDLSTGIDEKIENRKQENAYHQESPASIEIRKCFIQ